MFFFFFTEDSKGPRTYHFSEQAQSQSFLPEVLRQLKLVKMPKETLSSW